MKKLPVLLALWVVEALGASLWTFFTPSETASRVVLWLSAERLILTAVALAVFLGFLVLWVGVLRSPSIALAAYRILDEWILEHGALGALLIPLFVLPLVLLWGIAIVLTTPVSYAAYQAWAPETFPQLHSFALALAPLLVLLSLVPLELGMFLGLHYRGALSRMETWSPQRILPALTLVLIVTATGLQWFILGFQLRTFANIRAWYWKIQAIAFSVSDIWYAILVLALIAMIVWLGFQKRRVWLALGLIAVLGWLLQMGVGTMGRGGLNTLSERYFSTYHRAYVSRAAESNVGILDGIRRYEELYAGRAFTNTKPPGLMAFYIGLDHLVNGHPSAFTPAERYERLSTFILFAYPVLAVAMVPLLYAFTRRFVMDADPFLSVAAPFLYVLAPNFVLFSLFPDQAVYPLVFLLAAWLIIRVIRSGSSAWSFVLGAVLYLSVFFAFTMLPLYPLVGLYLILHTWRGRESRKWSRAVWMAIAVGLGTLVLYGAFRLLLNYDFFPRFARTMVINHNFDFYLRVGVQPPGAAESLPVRLGQILNAAWINNLDFAAAVGFPIYILFIVQVIRRLSSLRKPDLPAAEMVLAALTLSFLVLVFAGTAQGEVPRLWLFWLPLVAVLAALELRRYVERRSLWLMLIAAAEFFTMMFTFHFQDLRM